MKRLGLRRLGTRVRALFRLPRRVRELESKVHNLEVFAVRLMGEGIEIRSEVQFIPDPELLTGKKPH